MKLNHFTDIGMRILIHLSHLDENETSSLDKLSDTFQISRNHLIKVVQFLSQNKLIITKRGKSGGITIAPESLTKNIGDLIHLLEQDQSPIINCYAKPCIFSSQNCKLKSVFNIGYSSFITSLNQYTLNDLKFDNWKPN